MINKGGRPRSLVCGVGLNDAPYPTETGKYSGESSVCKFYQVWRDMIRRCYSDKFKEKHPSYKDCETVPEWLYFMNFRSWMETQDHEDNCLDKDLLFPDNKLYSPETCVFIPQALNKFLLDNKKNNGSLLKGVKYNSKTGKYRAECNNPFGKGAIGTFNTEIEAHEAYKYKKREIANLWADKQSDPRIAISLRSLFT